MHVERPDERLALLSKPALEPTTQFELGRDDCLIMCAGFEDRAVGVLENAVKVSADFTVIIIDYRPFIAQNHLDDIRNLCRKAKLRTVEILYDRENPVEFGATLLTAISPVSGCVLLDVSAMSRLLIVQSLIALASRDNGFENCAVVYTEATEYPPGDEEVREALTHAAEDPMHTVLLLSSGVFDITVVPELSSTSIAGDQTRLIAFPTFSADQLTALLNELGPSRLTLIHGCPPAVHNQWRTDAISKINRLTGIGIPLEELCASTLDYRETLNELIRLYDRSSTRERLLISPTGSKMQAVAVGLLRAFVDDIQIVYPTPMKFRSTTNYTKGIGNFYKLPLDVFAGTSNT